MALQTGGAIYCERGESAAFWAEPLNAITNAGFIAAAIAGAVLIARRPPQERSALPVFFIFNFLAIGVGSFLFHTMPSARTAAADTVPIGVFMLAYLAFAMRRFANASWYLTAAALAAFVGVMAVAFNLQCWDGRVGFLLENVPAQSRARCLNGSVGYAPATSALLLMAFWLGLKRHPAASFVFAAALTFVLSLTFRTFDNWLCDEAIVLGHRIGTHFIWHLLNSLTLFILLLASIKHGSRAYPVLPPRPKPRKPSYVVS
jgi:hypothetical protein